MSGSEANTEHHIEFFSAIAQGSGWTTAVSIDDSNWTFAVDEPEEDGGSNTGPNPMHHLVASLAGCQNEQAQVVAEELGIEANDIKLDLKIELNLDGFMGVADNSDGCFKSVRLNACVKGISQEQATQLGARVDARCPILSLIRSGGASIESNWTVC